VSGYLKDIALRRQLEEKVKEATLVRQEAERALQGAEELINRAKKIDATTTEADVLLAEATADAGAKDYRLALEKAVAAREKAARIYRDRIRRIIEASANLVAMTKRLGSDVSEGEAGLARARGNLEADEFEAAVDLATKVWKRSEKVLHEHLSESFSKAQALILTAKKIGKDSGPVEDLLSRARQAVESNDFETALAFLQECLDTVTGDLRGEVDRAIGDAEDLKETARDMGADVAKMAQLIERGRDDMAKLEFEKAINALKQSRQEGERALQKGLEARVANFTAWLHKAEKIGADTTGAHAILKQAERAIKENRFQEGATLARQGHEALQEAQFQRVLVTISQGRNKFVAAKNFGADLTSAVNLLQDSRQALQQGDFAGAIDLAKTAESEVERIMSEIRGVEDILRETTKAVAEAEARGASVETARRILDSVRNAIQERSLGGARDLLVKARAEVERTSYERAMEIVEKAEFLLTSGERMGADLSEPSRTLEEAIVATKEKDYSQATNLAGRSRDLAEAAIQKRLTDGIAGLTASLPFLGEESTNVRILIGKAGGALAAKDQEGAYAFLYDAQRVVESRMKERAIQFHETLRASVQLGQDLGADAASLGAALRDANAAMDNGGYADMIGIRERTGKDVVAASENLFNLVKQKVVQVKNLKINIDEMREILKRAKTSLSVEDYLEAIRFMQEANEKANRILDLYRATHHAISSSAALVAEAKKRDVDVTKVLEILLEAKRAFERLEFEKALELANRAKAETEKLMALYTSAQRLMSSRERLEVATRLGIEAPALVEVLNTAKEAMKAKEYERASRLTETVETELTEQIRNRIASLLTSMESLIVGEQGSVILGLPDKVGKVRGLVESQQYGQAADLVLQMRAELGKAKKLMENALIALKQARDAIADVETMQIDPTSAKKLLEKAEKAHKAGKLEEAVDLATKTISELDAETERLVATTMKRFEESILIAKRDGIDTRSAEKLFERAKGFLKERKFRQALAIAVQSETETERIGLQQDMASKALQTIEAKVAEFGQPIPPIQAILKEAKEASGGRDYVRALDLAIRAGDDFARFRETAEEASDSRGRAERIAKIVQRNGGNNDRVGSILAEAHAALAAGDADRARDTFEQAIEAGVKACKDQLTVLLQRTRDVVDLANRLHVEIPGSLKRFAEAKPQIENENFESAFQLIRDGREEAEAACAAIVSEALNEAEGTIEHAKKLNADVGGAEELVRQGKWAFQDGLYEEAMALIDRSREAVESRHLVEKRFVELSYRAESTIRNAKKFGIDVRDAERVLQGAMSAKKTDIGRALAAAEDAVRLSWQAVEAFAPSIQASLEVKTPKLERWSDATLILANGGKALAKEVKVRILGDAEVEGLKDIAAIRAKGEERMPLKIKMTAEGVVPLVIQVESRRVLDDKEYAQEMIAQVEVLSAQVPEQKQGLLAEHESRCAICKGTIKKGFTIAKCTCGRDFHELCSSRVGRCPVCFRPLETDDKKRKLAFRVG